MPEPLCIFCRRNHPVLRNVEHAEMSKKYEDKSSRSISVKSSAEGSFAKIDRIFPKRHAVGLFYSAVASCIEEKHGRVRIY